MTAPSLSVEGSAWHGEARLFGPLKLTVPAGQWTALLGASGVGKSTVLRLVAGLDTHARFDGEISANDGMALSGRVAFMAQSDLLFPWLSVSDNVCLGARLRHQRASKDRAAHLISEVGLSAHARKRPGALSGGQRQRAALARTLMEDRPIVLLDEPFSALDAKTRSEMQDLAATTLAGKSVLLVTHDPGEAARLADRIYIMSPEGVAVVETPPSRPPRDVEDSAALTLQGALLARLRRGS